MSAHGVVQGQAIVPISQINQLRHREVKGFAQGHVTSMAGKWGTQVSQHPAHVLSLPGCTEVLVFQSSGTHLC